MAYVDGFLLPVPKAKLAAYRRFARMGAKVWMEHGALDYKECVLDDPNFHLPDGGKAPSLFPSMVKAKRGETVVLAYIVFRSRAHRDRVNRKVMSDPRMAAIDPSQMPVDMSRMGYGGFRGLVEARQPEGR